MPPGGLEVGTVVAGRFTKWGGGPHWEWAGRYLGSDEYGHWWYSPPGTRCVRPGMDFEETVGWVSLAPHTGAYAAGFYPEAKHVSVYVDMTTEPSDVRVQPVGATKLPQAASASKKFQDLLITAWPRSHPLIVAAAHVAIVSPIAIRMNEWPFDGREAANQAL